MAGNGSKIGFWIAIAILGMLLFGSVLTNMGLLAALVGGGSSVANYDYPEDQYPYFDEVWSYGDGEAKVVRVALEGIIMRGQRERLLGYEPDMVESILAQIRAATEDESVAAILLEVDSPGGAVTPSDEIYAALERFKRADEERVVMVFVRDLGASGAYYAAMAGDYIMVEPTAIVGSVGVIMQTINMKGLGEKLGLSSVTIASGANKDMLNPFEEVNPEHTRLLRELVDSMQERFASIVEDARDLESRALLDGRVFTSEQAMENGLIDGVGYWDDALETLADMLGEDDLYVVRYASPAGFWDSFLGVKTPVLPDFSAMDGPRLMYLWKP